MSGIYAGYGGKTGDGNHGDSKFTVNGNVDMDVTGVALQANKDGFITVRGERSKPMKLRHPKHMQCLLKKVQYL